MIRAKELHGRAVIDVDTAEKLGDVHELILDPETRQVAALVATAGATFLGRGDRIVVPAAAVHAIGADAVTVSRQEMGGGDEAPSAALDALPRLSDITGRKVVTEGGKALGEIDDVLLDEESGRITGYALGGGGSGVLGTLLASPGSERRDDAFAYVRAESDLRVGPDVVVVPDEAVVREERHAESDVPAKPAAPTGPTMHEPFGRPETSTTTAGSATVPFTNSSRPAPTARTARWSSWAAPEGHSSPWTRREETVRTESHPTAPTTPSGAEAGRMP